MCLYSRTLHTSERLNKIQNVNCVLNDLNIPLSRSLLDFNSRVYAKQNPKIALPIFAFSWIYESKRLMLRMRHHVLSGDDKVRASLARSVLWVRSTFRQNVQSIRATRLQYAKGPETVSPSPRSDYLNFIRALCFNITMCSVYISQRTFTFITRLSHSFLVPSVVQIDCCSVEKELVFTSCETLAYAFYIQLRERVC